MSKSRISLAVWLILIFILNVFTQTTGAFVLLVLSIAFPLLSVLLNVLLPSRLRMNMVFPDSAEKEELIEGTLTVSNNTLLQYGRLKLKVKCENELTSEVTELDVSIPIGKTSSEYKLKFSSKYCGRLIFSISEARLFDVFGLGNKLCKIVSCEPLIVYFGVFSPKISESAALGTLGDTDRYSESKPGFDFSELFGIREYTPGDQIKSIHWKLSEKLDKIIVKEPGFPLQNSILLLFDTSYMDNNKPAPEVCDSMAEAFVSISQSLSEAGSPHTVGWFNNKTDMFESYEISNEDDGIGVLPKILSQGMMNNDFSCLEQYLNVNYGIDYSHIVCVTSYEKEGIMLPDTTKLIYLLCSEESSDEIKASDSEVIFFTPQTIYSELGILNI